MKPDEREDYSWVVNSPEDGFWDWRLDEKREIMSPQFWRMLGYEPEEQKEYGAWRELIHPIDLTLVELNLRLHVASYGDFPFLQEVRYKHKMGHYVWVRCHGHIVECDEDRTPTRIIGTHVDVTSEYVGDRQNATEDSSPRGMELAKLYRDYRPEVTSGAGNARRHTSTVSVARCLDVSE